MNPQNSRRNRHPAAQSPCHPQQMRLLLAAPSAGKHQRRFSSIAANAIRVVGRHLLDRTAAMSPDQAVLLVVIAFSSTTQMRAARGLASPVPASYPPKRCRRCWKAQGGWGVAPDPPGGRLDPTRGEPLDKSI